MKDQVGIRSATKERRQPDGFASLSADMMERRLGAPSGSFFNGNVEEGEAPQPPFGKRHDTLHDVGSAAGAYAGPERRLRQVSPVTERRKGMPPRVKVSVRLEPRRYDALRNASILTGRTHQDLLTSGLDAYLSALGVPAD